MNITLETPLIAIGNKSRTADFKTNDFISTWVESGRGAFLVDWSEDHQFQAPAGTLGYVLEWTSATECLFLSSPLLFELCRRSCKRLLFIGAEWEGPVETNIRVANSLGFDCYNYSHLGIYPVGFEERISRYSTSLKQDEIFKDIHYTLKPSIC